MNAGRIKTHGRALLLAGLWLLAGTAPAQTTPAQTTPAQTTPAQTTGAQHGGEKPAATQAAPETHITSAQAKELFRSVDEILRFASEDSKLPVHHAVKRRLTTRDAVERYIVEKFDNDEDAKRMQRAEIVLKKFGLLDRDFQLRPFLVSLLKEQIAGYYDNKSRTVNLLDWIEPDQQKPVLAHELTHALQDQHADLETWESKTSDSISRTAAEDNRRLSTDEDDSARGAVIEGQAMAVFMDYSLKPLGKSVLTASDLIEKMKQEMTDPSGSPVLARAPLLLAQSLLFPYREGLTFEQALLKDRGTEAAFAGVLDRPPSTSYEILNPRAYEQRQKLPLLRMPDVHGLLDAQYEPYDIGVMGQLDVRILAELFGGPEASATLTPAWDGGLYYAAQRKTAVTAAQKSGTDSLAVLYLSQWKTPEAARAFAKLYAGELSRKYTGVVRETAEDAPSGEEVFKTSEGPVLLVVDGRQVFVSESFDLATARKLELLLIGAQQDEGARQAQVALPRSDGGSLDELAASMTRFFAGCGLMRAGLPH